MGSIVYILEYSSYSVSYMKLTQIESSLLVRVLVYFWVDPYEDHVTPKYYINNYDVWAIDDP